jgi:hypothetical protein
MYYIFINGRSNLKTKLFHVDLKRKRKARKTSYKYLKECSKNNKKVISEMITLIDAVRFKKNERK